MDIPPGTPLRRHPRLEDDYDVFSDVDLRSPGKRPTRAAFREAEVHPSDAPSSFLNSVSREIAISSRKAFLQGLRISLHALRLAFLVWCLHISWITLGRMLTTRVLGTLAEDLFGFRMVTSVVSSLTTIACYAPILNGTFICLKTAEDERAHPQSVFTGAPPAQPSLTSVTASSAVVVALDGLSSVQVVFSNWQVDIMAFAPDVQSRLLSVLEDVDLGAQRSNSQLQFLRSKTVTLLEDMTIYHEQTQARGLELRRSLAENVRLTISPSHDSELEEQFQTMMTHSMERLESLVADAEEMQSELRRLHYLLRIMHGVIAEERLRLRRSRAALASSWFTVFGKNSAEIQLLESQRDLLATLDNARISGIRFIASLVAQIQGVAAELRTLELKTAGSSTSGNRIPLDIRLQEFDRLLLRLTGGDAVGVRLNGADPLIISREPVARIMRMPSY